MNGARAAETGYVAHGASTAPAFPARVHIHARVPAPAHRLHPITLHLPHLDNLRMHLAFAVAAGRIGWCASTPDRAPGSGQTHAAGPNPIHRSTWRQPMRAGLAAATLAALTLAAPAAAQPSGGEVLRGAIETLNRSHGPAVNDYAFTLVHNDVRTPVYVERGDEGWEVHGPEESVMGDLMGMAVLWPQFLAGSDSEEAFEGADAARYAGSEQVEGRRAHVVSIAVGEDFEMENVDSVTAYVDAQDRNLLRIAVAGSMPEGGSPVGGDMRLSVDMLEHRETEGVVLPRRLRVRMTLQMDMDPAERAQMTLGVAALQMQLQGSSDPEAQEMLAAMQLFSSLLSGDGMDLPMTVEDVVVNGGRPQWLEEQ
jgi:hypothetical protein